jgi:hypothetical protein
VLLKEVLSFSLSECIFLSWREMSIHSTALGSVYCEYGLPFIRHSLYISPRFFLFVGFVECFEEQGVCNDICINQVKFISKSSDLSFEESDLNPAVTSSMGHYF